MASWIITEWHEKNPNVWVALEMTDKPKKGFGKNPNKYILRGRAKTLKSLINKIGKQSELTLAKSWGYGIGKDMKIGESRDEYHTRKRYPQPPIR